MNTSTTQNITTTRIADLPDVNGQMNKTNQPPATTYTPINIHPNPYGNNTVVLPPTPPAYSCQGGRSNDPFCSPPPPPQSTLQPPHAQHTEHYTNGQCSGEDVFGTPNNVATPHDYQNRRPSSHLIPTQKLPSRDIRVEQCDYLQDEEIQPNFIPHSTSPNKNYVEEDENHHRKERREHASAKHRQSTIDKMVEELQTPFFVAMLFMVFQINAINIWMISNLAFLKLFKEDGNMNVNGMMFKSALFGLAYYVFVMIQTQLAK